MTTELYDVILQGDFSSWRMFLSKTDLSNADHTFALCPPCADKVGHALNYPTAPIAFLLT